MEEPLSRQLVICGMHRSGTSLVAGALQKAGLFIGYDVSGPGHGNPRGHFEDQDFFWLHEDMLAAAGESCFTAGDDFAPPENADFKRRARTIVAARDPLPLWGWKDPRTCLFLGFWEPLLPAARFLFLYRHPVEVTLSLWRRFNDPELQQDPWLAVRAWEVYNRRLLEFRDHHADRVFLAHVPALTADFGDLVRRLVCKLGLPLSDACPAPDFVPEELTALTPPHPAWEVLIPSALALYRRLEESADLPSREATELMASPSARERELLRSSEMLLFALLEKWGGLSARIQELEADLSHERQRTAELEEDLSQEHRRTADLAAALQDERAQTADAEARVAAAIQTLTEIERSRSFTPVRAWWRLRRWLGR